MGLALASVSRPGPVAACGYALAPGQEVDLAMSHALYSYRWGVQVDGFAGHSGSVVLSMDGHELPMRIHAGLNSPQAVLVSTVSHVRLRSTSRRGTICITDVRVGAIE